MKKRGLEVELVNEYVKKWAWTGRKVGALDQVYIFGKQAKSEHDLYGKVEYIITDSPLLLSPIYEKYYSSDGESIVEPSVLAHIEKAGDNGVRHINYLIPRTKPFNPKGRFETEETAKEIDRLVEKYLLELDIPFIQLTSVESDDKIQEILKDLGVI